MAEKGHDCKHSPFFFTITLVVFFPSKLHSPLFSSELYATFFQCNNYTRRFFNAIITCDVFPKITLAVFLELRFRLRVSLRMKMGAIIRLVCFIQTKNHVNTVQNFTFQSVNYEYNALFSFVFSKLYKQKLCVFCQGHIVIFLVALLQ
jgi:hypothetical protein